MAERSKDDRVEEIWRTYMTTGSPPEGAGQPWFESPTLRRVARRLPADPRCNLCYYPFAGIGGKIVRVALGLKPSTMNPQVCNVCERFARKNQGGAEVEVSLLFADVRGSTTIAEGMSPIRFSKLINRFYLATTKALYEYGGMVEKLIGDEVTGFFAPGFAGPKHARVALEAAHAVLQATGHGDASGPWIPVGVGVHTGTAYVGSVGEQESGINITVLGDSVNTAARLASVAGTGEIVFSEVTRRAAEWDTEGMERRTLELKGRHESVDAWIAGVNQE